MSSAAVDSMPRVLIVVTNEDLVTQMSADLKEAGYDAVLVSDVTHAIHHAETLKPALVVVDRMLGNDSGLALCQRIRGLGMHMPLLLLMARDSLEDRVACLEAGADDYFLKPYRSDEFLKRVQLYLQPTGTGNEQLRFGELTLDLANRTANRNGRVIDLTMKEFELLKYLMEHPRDVLTREQILENVWGYDFMGESNVIEVYIRYLRLKIDGENEKRLIQTVRGVGYVLRDA